MKEILERRRRAVVRAILAVSTLLPAAVAPGQTVIDDFSDAGAGTAQPPGISRTTVGSSSATDTGLSGVLGGSRMLTVEATAAGGGSPAVNSGVNALAQILDYTSSVLADGLVTLRYDADGVGLAVDLSAGDGIGLQLVTDSSALPYTVTLRLSDGVITESAVYNGLSSGLEMIDFLYSSFPTVDLSAIDSIEIEIDPNLAGDFETSGPGIVTFGEPICGNGVTEPEISEECDDGNAFSGDGCENDCTFSVACTYVHAGVPSERFVGGCGAPSFGTIQDAVDASLDGDVVSICPGTYVESVLVTRELRIRSTAGAASTTVQPAATTIFDVRRSGVTIEDLTLTAGTASPSIAIAADQICGLGLSSCPAPGRGSNLTISDNVISDHDQGIEWARKVDCVTIDGNTMGDNDAHISIQQADGDPAVLVTLSMNSISGGGSSGAVALSGLGRHLLVAQNSIDQSADAGLFLAALSPGPTTPMVVENNISNGGDEGVLIGPGGEATRVVQNNITGNALGLANEAPGGVVDATLNWWGSLTGPFHAVDWTTGMGDEIVERAGGLDTSFIEFLCAPAPAGFPSVGGVCDTGEPQEEVQFIAIGDSPDVSSSGRFISFVSDQELNGDERIAIDNADGGEEAFMLNRKPARRAGAFCLGGVNPGASCVRQSDCPADFDADPIVTEGACVLITQLSNEGSGSGDTNDPLVTRRGDVFFSTNANINGTNPDGSYEALMWSRRDFRRNEPPDPNASISEVSDGSSLEQSEKPQPDRGGRRTVFESTADFTGQNPDGNRELFVYDSRRDEYTQVTNTVGVDNRRPSVHTGRQILFDSDGDLTGANPDGNRELFLAVYKSSGWKITQLTSTTAPVDNRAGGVAKRGRILAFSSNGDFDGQNGDGNREIFVLDKEGFEQISDTTVGENVNADINPRGRFVVFESTSDVEATGGTLTNRRVILFDRRNGQTIVVSRSFFGQNFKPRISNGRFVVWESTANLTGSNPGGDSVIYLFDRRKDD